MNYPIICELLDEIEFEEQSESNIQRYIICVNPTSSNSMESFDRK